MAKRGRPTKYQAQFPRMAYEACSRSGMVDKDLAALFDCTKETLYRWQEEYPDFSDSIKRGKDEFDCATAENCLKKRIEGYEYTETTKEIGKKANEDTGEAELIITKEVTKQVAPDPLSIIFFLKNRHPERWRDTKDIRHSGKIDLGSMTDEELDQAEKEFESLE